jgi:hypothetical protein
MNDSAMTVAYHPTPWNKGKLIGQKPPLKLREIWALRTRLEMAGMTKELALFNLAIDSKLRGQDGEGLAFAPDGRPPKDTFGLRKRRAMRSEVAFDAFLELLDLTEVDAGDVVQWERENDPPGMAGEIKLLGQGLHDVERELPLQHAQHDRL